MVAWKAESRLDTLRRFYDLIGVTGSVNTGRDNGRKSNATVSPTPAANPMVTSTQHGPKPRRVLPRKSRLDELKRLHNRVSVNRPIYPGRQLILAPWSMIPQRPLIIQNNNTKHG